MTRFDDGIPAPGETGIWARAMAWELAVGRRDNPGPVIDVVPQRPENVFDMRRTDRLFRVIEEINGSAAVRIRRPHKIMQQCICARSYAPLRSRLLQGKHRVRKR